MKKREYIFVRTKFHKVKVNEIVPVFLHAINSFPFFFVILKDFFLSIRSKEVKL